MTRWYIRINGNQSGPMNTAQAAALSRVNPTAYAWQEGFAQWKPVSQIPELSQAERPARPAPMRPELETDEIDDRVPGAETGKGGQNTMSSDSTGDNRLEAYRFFLKDTIRLQIDFSRTGQSRNLAPPPLQKPCPPDSVRIPLPEGRESLSRLARMSVAEAIIRRESIRNYTSESLTLAELSAILYGAQGVRAAISPDTALRTVPSAGARHSFETYLTAHRVEGLTPGLYRYLPFDGELLRLSLDPGIAMKAARACLGQMFIASAAATLFWTTIPARMEWRYDMAAHKVIALDAGHVAQNLYLVATCVGAGACAVAAYHQDACDRLLGVDGQEEFTVYLAAVGKRNP